MADAYIIDACRTPRGIGKVGKGALASIHPQQLAATVLKAIAERNNVNTAEVDDIVWGTSSQRGKQGGLVELGVVAEDDHGIAGAQLACVDRAVRPVDADLGLT